MVKRNIKIPFKFTCVTDDPAGLDPHINVVPLWDKCRALGGCYNRLYTFSKDMKDILGERFVCIDVDTVIVGDLTPMFSRSEPFIGYLGKDSRGNPRLQGNFYMMDAGALDHVWETFIADPEEAIRLTSSKKYTGTDQAWMTHTIDRTKIATVGVREGMIAMRQDILKKRRTDLPEGAVMVHFSGPRDPTDSGFTHPWLIQHYR
jgi:hypothetical protein